MHAGVVRRYQYHPAVNARISKAEQRISGDIDAYHSKPHGGIDLAAPAGTPIGRLLVGLLGEIEKK